jgi:hypothetical protein
MALEKDLQKEILRKYGALTWLRLWRNNTGVAVGMSIIAQYKRMGYIPDNIPVTRYGTPGAPDIMGIIKGGQFLGIEVKSLTGQQSEEQKAWQRMIESLGGIYILARKVEDVDNILDKSRHP